MPALKRSHVDFVRHAPSCSRPFSETHPSKGQLDGHERDLSPTSYFGPQDAPIAKTSSMKSSQKRVDQRSSAGPSTSISTHQAWNARRVTRMSTSDGLKVANIRQSGQAKMRGRAAKCLAIGVCVCWLSALSYASSVTTASTGNYIAYASRTCGTERVTNYFPTHEILAVAVRRASCITARSVLKRYYDSKLPCQGSGCVRTDRFGWNCDTNSGDVQQRTGVITVCTRRHAVVESEVP